ncbi:MAG: type 11 methyltransferase [Parcubacteria group bacterium Gr01-1014_13]|nr:MAG: type 11 methyltransferase [Parcubacteria group bacterium Gr01-1014_13]
MICINCQTKMEPYFVKKTFHIMRCPSCKLMAVENIPADLSPYYSEGYFTGDVTLDGYIDYDLDKEVTKKTYIDYIDLLAKYIHKQGQVSMFEVGCATGFFMDLARQRGWETEGIDISEYAVKKAQEKGLAASATTLESYQSVKKFDVIVMQDVIEHVKDPVDVINRAKNLLADKGLLLFTTPDAGSLWARVWNKKWHAFVPPQHLFYFSAKNLGSILEKNGFEVVHTAHHGKWFTVPYIIRLLYSWTGLKIFSKLAEWSAKSFLKDFAIPINVRDTLSLVARKI